MAQDETNADCSTSFSVHALNDQESFYQLDLAGTALPGSVQLCHLDCEMGRDLVGIQGNNEQSL